MTSRMNDAKRFAFEINTLTIFTRQYLIDKINALARSNFR